MSTTNQYEKTKEDNATRRKRIKLESEPKRVPVIRESENTDSGSKEPAIPKAASRKDSKTEVSDAKERRRQKSLSAEEEMTDSLKQERRQQRKQQKEEKRKNKKPRLRIIPIWLRIVLIAGLSFIALCVGLMIGYGGLGDGDPTDALKWETWQHIVDLIYKEK
ncbi:DNA-directed RNA polymerase subunit beta [Ornithinibacillus bavariensis]|nr:DNA-directed RNA polymerase subunit beta [Ornithinibacillus bavariensis]